VSCVVLGLDMPDEAALRFLDELDRVPAARQVPILAHHTRRLDSPWNRRLTDRFQGERWELLPSLDELRERVVLHLTVGRPTSCPWCRPSAPWWTSPWPCPRTRARTATSPGGGADRGRRRP